MYVSGVFRNFCSAIAILFFIPTPSHLLTLTEMWQNVEYCVLEGSSGDRNFKEFYLPANRPEIIRQPA